MSLQKLQEGKLAKAVDRGADGGVVKLDRDKIIDMPPERKFPNELSDKYLQENNLVWLKVKIEDFHEHLRAWPVDLGDKGQLQLHIPTKEAIKKMAERTGFTLAEIFKRRNLRSPTPGDPEGKIMDDWALWWYYVHDRDNCVSKEFPNRNLGSMKEMVRCLDTVDERRNAVHHSVLNNSVNQNRIGNMPVPVVEDRKLKPARKRGGKKQVAFDDDLDGLVEEEVDAMAVESLAPAAAVTEPVQEEDPAPTLRVSKGKRKKKDEAQAPVPTEPSPKKQKIPEQQQHELEYFFVENIKNAFEKAHREKPIGIKLKLDKLAKLEQTQDPLAEEYSLDFMLDETKEKASTEEAEVWMHIMLAIEIARPNASALAIPPQKEAELPDLEALSFEAIPAAGHSAQEMIDAAKKRVAAVTNTTAEYIKALKKLEGGDDSAKKQAAVVKKQGTQTCDKWAKAILKHSTLRSMFCAFFEKLPLENGLAGFMQDRQYLDVRDTLWIRYLHHFKPEVNDEDQDPDDI